MPPLSFPNTGAIEREPDVRDFTLQLGYAVAVPETYMPDTFFNRPIFYQRQIPDCGANAGAFIAALRDEHTGQEYSPDYQWIDIKTLDGFPLDAGTDMRSIFKSLTNGSLPYAMLPEETTLPLAAFSSMNRVTPAMKNEVVNHKIAAYGFHNESLTLDTLKNLIYANGAVVLLMRIGNEFWTDKNGKSSWAEKDILPLRPSTGTVSGHFIVAGAYDKDYIYFANWWSADWGRKGYGYFGANYLPQIIEVGTIVDSLDKVTLPTFSRDLHIGMSGADVKELQKYLNAHGFTIATSGIGSTGNETTYFGELTQKALVAFQKAHGITPAIGYFGVKTRAVIK